MTGGQSNIKFGYYIDLLHIRIVNLRSINDELLSPVDGLRIGMPFWVLLQQVVWQEEFCIVGALVPTFAA